MGLAGAGLSRRGILAALAALPVMGTLSPLATGAASEAKEAFVSRVANEVLEVARAGGAPARFSALLTRYSAINEAALFALGPYRRRLPARRRAEFLRLAHEFVVRLFARQAGTFAGERVRVTGSAGNVVDTEVVFADGRTLPVRWRLVAANGGYRIFDVNVSGIWVAIVMRDEFTSILRESAGDFNALIVYLRTGHRPAIYRR